jgi:hypothetical protein
MASTIALIGMITFVAFMIIIHKLRNWCTPTATASTNDAGDKQTIGIRSESHGDLSSMVSDSSSDACASPLGAYAIAIAEGSPNEPLSPIERKISFIRFSGYTDSNASISDRSTALSFWSALNSAKESECSPPSPVEPVEPKPKRTRPYIPRLYDENEVIDGAVAVTIAPMPGFLERNMLAFKQQKPLILTTKHIKKMKHARPLHAFLV